MFRFLTVIAVISAPMMVQPALAVDNPKGATGNKTFTKQKPGTKPGSNMATPQAGVAALTAGECRELLGTVVQNTATERNCATGKGCKNANGTTFCIDEASD